MFRELIWVKENSLTEEFCKSVIDKFETDHNLGLKATLAISTAILALYFIYPGFINEIVSKISIIGVGMITTPGVTFRMFQSLANKKINIKVISTSEIKISVLIDKKNTQKALIALHKEFKLDQKK